MKEKLLQSSYKPIIIIPLIVTILSLVLVAVNGLPGSIDLDGGTTTVLNLEKPVSQSELENIISTGMGNPVVDVVSITGTQAQVEIRERGCDETQ